MDKETTLRQIKHEKTIRSARKNINVFNELVMRDAKTGNKITQQSIHISWQNHIDWCWEKGYHAGILAMWGHGKTNQAIGRVLYEVGKAPNNRIKVVSNSDDTATNRVNAIKNYIEHSSEYHEVFPKIKPNKDQWGAHKLSVQRDTFSPDPTIEAYGILSTGIGSRADMIVFDDVVDRKNAIQEPKKQIQVIETFYGVWMGRLEPGGRALYIATRWTMTDLTSELLKSSAWCWLIQAVSKDCRYIDEKVIIGAG